jgi:DNA-binding HxlR family transcriptional regulator
MHERSDCAPSSHARSASGSDPAHASHKSHDDRAGETPKESAAQQRLSYKFQRLRERLRAAVASGELSGKLPGERQLAKRFRVNAKTLSKALTDLAAEGLLERSIGRGTYVRALAPQTPSTESLDPTAKIATFSGRQRWLAVCNPDQADNPILAALRRLNPQTQLVADLADRRPSFLMACDGVAIFNRPDEASIRNLLVRGKTVVFVDCEPAVFSTHALLLDRALGVSLLMRDLLLGGHRKIAVVEDIPAGIPLPAISHEIIEAARLAQARYASDAIVEPCQLRALSSLILQGTAAVLCPSAPTAAAARPIIEQAGGRVGQTIALAAVGYCDTDNPAQEPPCTGYFVEASRAAESLAQLLNGNAGHRPMTMWLTGPRIDRGTICAVTDSGLRHRASA